MLAIYTMVKRAVGELVPKRALTVKLLLLKHIICVSLPLPSPSVSHFALALAQSKLLFNKCEWETKIICN